MVRTRRGERTLAEIVDAARAHLLESGLDSFSLREVARRAELTPSSLYNHFGSREDLVNHLAMEAVHLLGSYLERVPKNLPAKKRLALLADEYLRFAVEQPERYRLVFDTLVAPPADWTHYAAVAYPFSLIIEAVCDGIASDQIEDRGGIGAAGIAYGLWALVHGSVMLSARHLKEIVTDLGPFQKAAVEAYLDGIERRGSS